MFDPVAQAGKPQRIAPGSTTDVSDNRRWRGQDPKQDLLGPLELHDTQTLCEAVGLPPERVMRLHPRKVGVHPLMVSINTAHVHVIGGHRPPGPAPGFWRIQIAYGRRLLTRPRWGRVVSAVPRRRVCLPGMLS